MSEFNKEQLIDLYWNQKYSLKGVAEKVGAKYPATIYKAFKRMEIPTRKHAIAMNTNRCKDLIRAHKNDTAGVNNGMFGVHRSKKLDWKEELHK